MIEMSIWVPILLAEACLLSSGILGFLLWRTRRQQRRLRAEMAAYQHAPEKPPHTETESGSAPEPPPQEAGQADNIDPATTARITALFQSSDELDLAVNQLQEKRETFEQLLDVIQTRLQQADNSEEKIALLERMLRDARGVVAVLEQTDTYIRQCLREQNHRLRECVDELRWSIRQRATLEATVKQLQTTNVQLLQALEKKDKLIAELRARTSPEERNGNAQEEAITRELLSTKRQLAQRITDLQRLQEQYDDLSTEYQNLFQASRIYKK
ncbi:MAG TPA: hypothetical protein VIH59_20730 [Candidatus Tectomicrobia bacterium]